jgi:salicylate hydroxylase
MSSELCLTVPSRRYDSDEELKYSPMLPPSGNKYGAPMGVIHRGDLHRILLEAARKNGCRILTSHT